MDYHLVVIGGGAAGFFGAISCAELSQEKRSILILEKGGDVLQKVKISGGGRCNVTHDCHDPREFVTHYPRGEKNLTGPLYQWNAADMIDWLEQRGIELKVEADGRMFPTTNRSETIIDCFRSEIEKLGIEVRCRQDVESVDFDSDIFTIRGSDGTELRAHNVLIATGGIRNRSGATFAEAFGHSTKPASPSLFTFKITDPRIEELAGISVTHGKASIVGNSQFSETGPILITHWGLSGPGILKLSARAARELHQLDYQFEVMVNWTADISKEAARDSLAEKRVAHGKQSVMANPQFGIPARLWKRLCQAAEIQPETKWANLSRTQLNQLLGQLQECRFSVVGKSMNKEEFVTCGGVCLDEINFKTMQSKLQPGLYFAGEVLDIDGVTGGFNFQSAWTTARIAGQSLAATTST